MLSKMPTYTNFICSTSCSGYPNSLWLVPALLTLFFAWLQGLLDEMGTMLVGGGLDNFT